MTLFWILDQKQIDSREIGSENEFGLIWLKQATKVDLDDKCRQAAITCEGVSLFPTLDWLTQSMWLNMSIQQQLINHPSIKVLPFTVPYTFPIGSCKAKFNYWSQRKRDKTKGRCGRKKKALIDRCSTLNTQEEPQNSSFCRVQGTASMGNCWGSPPHNPTPTTTGNLSTGWLGCLFFGLNSFDFSWVHLIYDFPRAGTTGTSQAISSGSYTTTTTTTTTSSGSGSSSINSKFSVSSGDQPYPNGQILPTSNLRIFTFAELKAATRNFKADTVLGEGGFGKVFKGWLEEKATSKGGSGTVIAVKKLNSESLQGLEEWQVN